MLFESLRVENIQAKDVHTLRICICVYIFIISFIYSIDSQNLQIPIMILKTASV